MSFSVGIDVGKQHLDWAVGSEAKAARASNTARGVRGLVARLRTQQAQEPIDRVIVESTGGYERPLLEPMYQRLIEAGKPPKVAFIAIARKLLTVLDAMERDRTEWQQVPA